MVDEKRCLMICGLKEKEQPMRHIKEKEKLLDIIAVVHEEYEELNEEIEKNNQAGKVPR